jgi:hypothetical protein
MWHSAHAGSVSGWTVGFPDPAWQRPHTLWVAGAIGDAGGEDSVRAGDAAAAEAVKAAPQATNIHKITRRAM